MLQEKRKGVHRKFAVPTVFAGMWFVGHLAFAVFKRRHTGVFYLLDGWDEITLSQIGIYYLLWLGSQMTSALVPGFVIVNSRFRHRVGAAFWLAFLYHMFCFCMRAIAPPWWARISELDWRIPVLGELLAICLLVGMAVLWTWLLCGPLRNIDDNFLFQKLRGPRGRKTAIVASLASLWLLGCVGVYIAVCVSSSRGVFFLHNRWEDATELRHIGWFYLAWFAAQMPACGFAGIIIAKSGFRQPVRLAFWLAFGLHVFLFGMDAGTWPFVIPELGQSVARLAELSARVLLVAFVAVCTWCAVRVQRS